MIPLPEVPTDGLTPWNPWKTLPHLDHVYVDFHASLPEGVQGLSCQSDNGTIAIALDANLGQNERCWTLAHELIHISRGGSCKRTPGATFWEAMTVKEEAHVNAVACDLVVPPRLLAVEVERALTLDEDPDLAEVADRFWVPKAVARYALHRLKHVHQLTATHQPV